MADIYKISESWMNAWVRNGPGVNYDQIDIIYGENNEEYSVTERKNSYWLKIGEDRWVCDRDTNDLIIMVKVRTEEEKVTTVTTDPEDEESEEVDEESYAYIPDADDINTTDFSITSTFEQDLAQNLTISNLRGIFGMPYQFMPSADPRLFNTDSEGNVIDTSDKLGHLIGRKYANEIVANMPLLLMTAGKPVFMAEYNDSDKKTILGSFVSSVVNFTSEITETVLSKDFGKYYTLDYAYNEYFNYVNPMCQIAARVMNLHNKEIHGTPLESYRWNYFGQNINNRFSKIFSVYRGCTAWYCDSETSISDSWSNDTAQSFIADKINNASDYGRELNFLLGTVKSYSTPGSVLDKFTNAADLEHNMESINQYVNDTLGSSGVGGIFKTLTNSIQTVVAGGKLVFPEIWAGSSFARSYNINLKLVSPDADNFSIYLNIIVPILHLLGFVLPREAPSSHGYISPFLVRAYYKGLFNVDMGIMTDLSINKGKESAWTPSGLPTTVDVSFTIKDLYNDMYMTNMDNIKHNMLNNIILMDYIANLCGVNINEVDVIRGIDLFWIMNVKNRITNIWHKNIYGGLHQGITNKVQDIFGRF